MAQRLIVLEPRMTVVEGSLPGIGRPSLHAFVCVSRGADVGGEALARVDAALDQALASPQQSAPPAGPAHLPGRLLGWIRRVHEAGGWPVASDGLAEPAATTAEPGRFGIAIPFLDGCAEEARQTLLWAVDLADAALAGTPTMEIEARLGPLVERLKRVGPQGMNTARFLAAAARMGVPWRRVSGNVYQFGHGAEAVWLDSSYTDQSACIASTLARNKFDAAFVLRRAGVPVPRHQAVTTPAEAVAAAEKMGFPVVVKPIDRDGGKGVAVELESPIAVAAAAEAALRLSHMALVEQFIPGNDYRLQVHRGEVIWASHRIPGGVTGDGAKTVAALLAELNADPRRGEPGSAALLKRIALDDEARNLLARQGLSTEDVPAAGRFVRLRRAANVASGGRAVGVLEQVHPDNLALAARAAEALRLDLAGVDLLIPDISRSWLEGGAAVCEVNAQPQLWPTLPETILGRLVRGQGRIPLVGVLGGPGDAAWAAEIAAAAGVASAGVGFASRAGAMLGGETILRGPADLLAACEALLFDRRVRAAVVFVDDARLLQTGLPSDAFDLVALVGGPGASGDWPRWLALGRLFGMACRGRIVAAADDPRWAPLAAALAGRPIAALAREEIGRIMLGAVGRQSAAARPQESR